MVILQMYYPEHESVAIFMKTVTIDFLKRSGGFGMKLILIMLVDIAMAADCCIPMTACFLLPMTTI